jgi:hypothetical protein
MKPSKNMLTVMAAAELYKILHTYEKSK